ncbi:MAG: hypothetical protein ACYS5V_01120, partial [Planctomycetota bacterium]
MPSASRCVLVPRGIAALAAVAVVLGGAGTIAAVNEIAPGTEAASLGALYDQARASFSAGRDDEYEQAATEIISRGDRAVAFLAARLDSQAEKVRGPEDLRPSGILVTINLLG